MTIKDRVEVVGPLLASDERVVAPIYAVKVDGLTAATFWCLDAFDGEHQARADATYHAAMLRGRLHTADRLAEFERRLRQIEKTTEGDNR